MTPKERTEARERLEDLAAKLTASIKVSEADGDTVAPDNAIGRLTRMEALQASAMSAATRARQKKRLRQVEQAMKRLDEGDYGICYKCGDPIPSGRLEYMPETRVCVSCAGR